jgi:hypothetical protein
VPLLDTDGLDAELAAAKMSEAAEKEIVAEINRGYVIALFGWKWFF